MNVFSSLRSLWTAGRGISMGVPDVIEGSNPVDLFQKWFEDARNSDLFLPEAMTVASCSLDGKPSARTVLLKTADSDGFVFYTNYESRKASELDSNPNVSLLFHWPILQRQVRIEGVAERVTREESNEYFQSRPRGSRIGAWASSQSARLSSPEELKSKVKEMEERFKGEEVPLPDHWGGYRIRPERVEFWQGRPFRLHDRLIFEKTDSSWDTHRLYP